MVYCNKYKFLAWTLYTLLVVCMGLATVVEKFCGKTVASDMIYGSWWFVALWALTAVVSLFHLVCKKTYRRFPVMLLHTAFVVILLGALTTHLTSADGTLHIRKGATVSAYTDSDGATCPLPFTVSLTDFEMIHYPGTDAVMDYKAHIVVDADGRQEALCVSMNNIGKFAGYRFYQTSYDNDGQGTVLLVAYDPYGIAVTYIGYLMLLAGLTLTMCSRHSALRRLLHVASRPSLTILLLSLFYLQAKAAPTVDKETADEMGQIAVLYNGRICPLNTAATDFVTKLCGKPTWQGMSANEIFVGWTIFYTHWERQPIIKVKNREVQTLLGIDGKWACVRDFYTSQNEYKLTNKICDASLSESTRKAIRETDEKVQVVTMFYNSELLRIFPLSNHGVIEWHKPGSTELPEDVGEAEFQFINHAMDHLVIAILSHDTVKARSVIAKIKLYQREKARDLLPSPALMHAEIIYNRLQASLWAVFVCLALSLLFCCLMFAMPQKRTLRACHTAFVLTQTAYVATFVVLRTAVSRHVPLSDGFETMLFMSFVTMLLTLTLSRRFPVVKSLGPVVSSLSLLVAMFAVANPQVTSLMPVLRSPLLALHVALVMTAYALLAVATLLSVRCLALPLHSSEMRRTTALTLFLLHPAAALLAVGIFVGAVWANVSWGTYWSWDPKETWALVTLMVYAVPLHQTSRWLNRPSRLCHWYVVLSFLAVVMTYFGVNYFLSGMHSYA